MSTIIAFSGKIGSGKTYITEQLVFPYLRNKNKNVVILSFADYLKILCNVKDRILYERLFVEKDIESRRVLQERGTREREENKNVFIESLDCMMKMMKQRGADVILVPDVRYNNEFNFLRQRGAVLIQINAPKRSETNLLKECEGNKSRANMVSSHVSEKELENRLDFDFYINNDFIYSENLTDNVYSILDKII